VKNIVACDGDAMPPPVLPWTTIKHWHRWAPDEHLWYCTCTCGWRSGYERTPHLAEEREAEHLATHLAEYSDESQRPLVS
jgi:hypothetical protein